MKQQVECYINPFRTRHKVGWVGTVSKTATLFGCDIASVSQDRLVIMHICNDSIKNLKRSFLVNHYAVSNGI